MRPTGLLRHDLIDGPRLDQIGQAVAAKQQGGVGLERNLEKIDEVGIRLLVRLRADVGTPRSAAVPSSISGSRWRPALADRRDRAYFLDAIATKLHQPRVTHTDRRHVLGRGLMSTHAITVHSGRVDATR
jgi:hypothetical protein